MSARELAAWAYLVDASHRLEEHRAFVRARRAAPGSSEATANADEHERISAALHRTREAIGHLNEIPTVRSMLLEAQRDRDRDLVDIAGDVPR